MDIDYEYVCGQFRLAVESLASGTRTLQERLENVAASFFIVLQDRDFPPKLLPRYKGIWAAATDSDDGSIEEACKSLDDETARHIAKRIVDMFEELVRITSTMPMD